MSSLRGIASFALLALLCCASPALSQTAPGVPGGNYDGSSLIGTSYAPGRSSVSTWSPGTGLFAFSVSRWWSMYPTAWYVEQTAISRTQTLGVLSRRATPVR